MESKPKNVQSKAAAGQTVRMASWLTVAIVVWNHPKKYKALFVPKSRQSLTKILSHAGFDLYGLLFLEKIPVEPVVPKFLKFNIL